MIKYVRGAAIPSCNNVGVTNMDIDGVAQRVRDEVEAHLNPF
jgi:hypothetical protein